MRCGTVSLVEESYIYQHIRDNRRSNRTAPSDCLFGFNGVDSVAVRERSSSTEKYGGSMVEDLLLTESKTSIKLEANDSELNDVRINMLSVSNVLNQLRQKRFGTNQNRGDRVRNSSLRGKTTTKLKVISTGDKQNEKKEQN